jgi:hypothetical protein
MPTLILPGEKQKEVAAAGPIAVRDLRQSIRLQPKYRLLMRRPNGELAEAGEDDLVDPHETLQAIPRSMPG